MTTDSFGSGQNPPISAYIAPNARKKRASERRIVKRILLLTLLLLLPFGCRKTLPDAAPFSGTDVGIRDVALLSARAEELRFRIERGELSAAQAKAKLDALSEAQTQLETTAAIARIRYCRDVTDAENRQAYGALCGQLDALCGALAACRLLTEHPAEREQNALLRTAALCDPAVRALFARERELLFAYEALPLTLTVPYGGRQWNGNAILSDQTLPEADFAALYETYMTLFHDRAADLYLELVDVRNRIAAACGCRTYAEYACPDRMDAEAAAFSARVKAAFVPLLPEWTPDLLLAAGRLYGMTFPQEETLTAVGEAIADLLPELRIPWDGMLARDLYDLGPEETRYPLWFSITLPSYGVPYLFGTWTGGSGMPAMLAHTFGQFASQFRNKDVNKFGNAFECAEFRAAGLELLLILRYDRLYGNMGPAAETAELIFTVYTLAALCAEDAFERFAYETPDLSEDALDAEYARLQDAYGLSPLTGDPRSWTQSARLFESPLSGIGRAAGTAAALELYRIAKQDPRRAVSAYRSALSEDPDAAFRDVLLRAGLPDPFAANTLKQTAYGLSSVRRDRKIE